MGIHIRLPIRERTSVTTKYTVVLLLLNSLAVVLFVYLSHVYWQTNVRSTQRNLGAQAAGSAALLDSKLTTDQDFLRQTASILPLATSPSMIHSDLVRLIDQLGPSNASFAAVVTGHGQYVSRLGPLVPLPSPPSGKASLGTLAPLLQSAFREPSFFLSLPFADPLQRNRLWVVAGSPVSGPGHRYLIIGRGAFLPVLDRQLASFPYSDVILQLLRRNGLVQSQSPAFPPGTSKVVHPDWFSQQIARDPQLASGMGTGTIGPRGPSYLIAFSKLNDYPLYVVESVPVHAVFAGWLHTMLLGLIAFVCLVILSDGSILFIIYRLHMSREHHAFTLKLYNVLSQVSRITSTAATESDCLEALAPALCAQAFHAAWIGIAEADSVRVLVAAGPGSDALQQLPFSIGGHNATYQSLVARAVLTQHTLYDNDITTALTHQGYASLIKTYRWASGISIPIMRQHRVWGVLNLISDRPKAFDQNILPLTDQIGWSLQDALERFDLRQLEAQMRRRNQLILTFHHVLGAIGEVAQKTMDESVILQDVCSLLTESQVFAAVGIGIPGTDGILRFPYRGGEPFAYGDQDTSETESTAARAWRTGRYQVENDWEDPAAYHPLSAAQPWQSSADFVIYRSKEPYAVLEVYHRDKDVFDAELIQLGIRLAELVGQILTNARNETELHRLHQFYEALAHANELLLYTDDPQTLYESLAELIMAQTTALGCWIAFSDGSRLDIKTRVFQDAATAVLFDRDIQQIYLGDPTAAGPTVISDVLASKKPVVVNDLAAETRYPGPHLMRYLLAGSIGAVAAFPIANGTGQSGVLTVHGAAHLFSDEIITLLQSLAYNLTAKLRFLRAEEEEETVKAQLAYQASHDALTQIPNRAHFERTLDELAGKQRRGPVPATMIMADLDKFKLVNDTYGHAAGDYVLQVTAKRLQGCLRAEDTLCRYGGDEFVILIESALPSLTLHRLAGCLLTRVQEPVLWNNTPLTVGISLGVATDTEGAKEPRQLFKEADEAVYAAKQHGKNRVQFR